MNLIAVLILAPILGLLVGNRRVVFLALTVVWAVLLAPTAHMVLLEDEVDKRSMTNTVSFFAVSYLGLAVGLGIAYLVHRRRWSVRSKAAASLV